MPRGPRMVADLDHVRRMSPIKSDGQIVVGHHQVLAQDLDQVQGGRDDRVVVDLAGLDQKAVLDVGEAPALADAAPSRLTATEPVSTTSISGSSSSAITRPCRSALDRRRLAHLLGAQLARVEQPERCGSRRRGTAITIVLPSSRARRRTWVWGESGFALITWARFQIRCPASRSAASLAPASSRIRPSAPGKRETPSRSIAFQTARLT